MSENNKHPNPSLWWKHRRKMAYLSLTWIIVQTFLWCALSVFFPGTLVTLGAVIGWSYGASIAILGGYFTNTAVEEAMKHKQNW